MQAGRGCRDRSAPIVFLSKGSALRLVFGAVSLTVTRPGALFVFGEGGFLVGNELDMIVCWNVRGRRGLRLGEGGCGQPSCLRNASMPPCLYASSAAGRTSAFRRRLHGVREQVETPRRARVEGGCGDSKDVG